MGASISTNSVNSMIDNAVSVLNSYNQVCSFSGTGSVNQIVIKNGCKITDGTQLLINNNTVVNQSCITNANIQTSISADISQTMRQAATAISQQFSFPSIAAANNFITDAIALGDAISNTFNQTCNVDNSGQQNLIVCDNSTISGSVVKIDDYKNFTQTCVLKTVIGSNIYNKVLNDLQQTSVAKQESTFLGILLAIVVLLAILAWFAISVMNSDITKWIVVLLILFFVISSVVYTVTAKNNGNYPYTKP